MSKEVKILETPPPGHAGEGFCNETRQPYWYGQSKFSLAASVCYILLRNRVYGDDEPYL